MMGTMERRFLPLEDVELRADEEGLHLSGYGAVFNAEATIMGAFREQVAPGAYAKTIQEGDIRALWNHDPSIVLGRNRSGTLKLEEDDRGLRFELTPPDNEWGRPVVDAVKRGDVSGASILFAPIKQEWQRGESGELALRTIKEARLFSVDPVTFPVFTETSVRARSEDGQGAEIEDILIEARRIERCAAHGMELTRADRDVLDQAVAMLQSRMALIEPEPDNGDHSESEPETETVHHSADERARWLALVEQTL